MNAAVLLAVLGLQRRPERVAAGDEVDESLCADADPAQLVAMGSPHRGLHVEDEVGAVLVQGDSPLDLVYREEYVWDSTESPPSFNTESHTRALTQYSSAISAAMSSKSFVFGIVMMSVS